MNKIFRFFVPFMMACLSLGMIFYLVGVSSRANASDVKPVVQRESQGELVVTTLYDLVDPDDGLCSLREAIQAANTNSTVEDCGTGNVLTDTITFSQIGILTVTQELLTMGGGPLLINGGGNISLSGGRAVRILNVDSASLLYLDSLSFINGSNFFGAAISNNGTLAVDHAVFSGNQGWAGLGINNGGILTVTNSLFTGNGIAYAGAAFANGGVMTVISSTLSNNHGGYGGAIDNGGVLTLINTTISDNYADDNGAGVNNAGSLMLIKCDISNNSVGQGGGGIYNTADGELTMINSKLSGNSSAYQAGAVYIQSGRVEIIESTVYSNSSGQTAGGIMNLASLSIINSTLSENVAGVDGAGNGGGIMSNGTLTITNSTLSGNEALGAYGYPGLGGGIYNYGAVTINSSTLSGNSADSGGGIYHSYGSAALANSIVANSPQGGDCWAEAAITDGGYNIDSDDSCGFDIANGSMPNSNPLLGSLRDNGGPTLTHPLFPGSPAIDTGDDAQCPPTDQRSVLRPIDGDWDGIAICDIGSFEYDGPPSQPFFLPLVIKSP